MEKVKQIFQKTTQVALPVFTAIGFLLTGMKRPDLGLVLNLIAQVFWLYAGYQAWKKANQIGIFITSLIITVFLIYGVANYWLIK